MPFSDKYCSGLHCSSYATQKKNRPEKYKNVFSLYLNQYSRLNSGINIPLAGLVAPLLQVVCAIDKLGSALRSFKQYLSRLNYFKSLIPQKHYLLIMTTTRNNKDIKFELMMLNQKINPKYSGYKYIHSAVQLRIFGAFQLFVIRKAITGSSITILKYYEFAQRPQRSLIAQLLGSYYKYVFLFATQQYFSYLIS